MKRLLLLIASVALAATTVVAASDPQNPCAKKAQNPCNPCAKKKGQNPCNPCAKKKGQNPCNPCAKKAMNPCNPCAKKKAMNPCAMKKASGEVYTPATAYSGWMKINKKPFLSEAHGGMLVTTFANATAEAAIRSKQASFLVGSILVKESHAD